MVLQVGSELVMRLDLREAFKQVKANAVSGGGRVRRVGMVAGLLPWGRRLSSQP
jgi:hypothetical protein